VVPTFGQDLTCVEGLEQAKPVACSSRVRFLSEIFFVICSKQLVRFRQNGQFANSMHQTAYSTSLGGSSFVLPVVGESALSIGLTDDFPSNIF